MVKNTFQTPSECPVCGESVPRTAKSCPGCGADERSGWDEDTTRYDGLDLPDHAFDKLRSRPPMPLQRSRAPWLIATALILIAALSFLLLR